MKSPLRGKSYELRMKDGKQQLHPSVQLLDPAQIWLCGVILPNIWEKLWDLASWGSLTRWKILQAVVSAKTMANDSWHFLKKICWKVTNLVPSICILLDQHEDFPSHGIHTSWLWNETKPSCWWLPPGQQEELVSCWKRTAGYNNKNINNRVNKKCDNIL